MIARAAGYLLGRFGFVKVALFLVGVAVIGFAVLPGLLERSAVVPPAVAHTGGHTKPVANGRHEKTPSPKVREGTGGLY